MKDKLSQSQFPIMVFALFLFLEICIFLLQKVVSVKAVGGGYSFYSSILMQPWVWLSLVLAIIQLFLWRTVLSRSDLSVAYSLSSISYPLTMLAASYLFKEHLSLWVWGGAFLITAGVLLIGMDSKE